MQSTAGFYGIPMCVCVRTLEPILSKQKQSLHLGTEVTMQAAITNHNTVANDEDGNSN